MDLEFLRNIPAVAYSRSWFGAVVTFTRRGEVLEKLLVIEDDRATRKALKQLFEVEGYTVEVAENGAEFHEDSDYRFRFGSDSEIRYGARRPVSTWLSHHRKTRLKTDALTGLGQVASY